MPRALQISGTATPLANSASASRSLRMICSGEWRMRFIESPPALVGKNDSHIGWISLRGAGHMPGRAVAQEQPMAGQRGEVQEGVSGFDRVRDGEADGAGLEAAVLLN